MLDLAWIAFSLKHAAQWTRPSMLAITLPLFVVSRIVAEPGGTLNLVRVETASRESFS